MGQAHQPPFAADLVQATQQKPAKAPRLLDLAEDRLDDRLPPCVDGAARGRLQLRLHLLLAVAGATAGSDAAALVAPWCRCRSVAM